MTEQTISGDFKFAQRPPFKIRPNIVNGEFGGTYINDETGQRYTIRAGTRALDPTPPAASPEMTVEGALARLRVDALPGYGRFDESYRNNPPKRHSEYWNLIGEVRADIMLLLMTVERQQKVVDAAMAVSDETEGEDMSPSLGVMELLYNAVNNYRKP